MAQALGRVEAKLDAYHDEVKSVKVRVRRLESKWARVAAVFSLLTLPFTYLISHLRKSA
jgi:hypothetical protein